RRRGTGGKEGGRGEAEEAGGCAGGRGEKPKPPAPPPGSTDSSPAKGGPGPPLRSDGRASPRSKPPAAGVGDAPRLERAFIRHALLDGPGVAGAKQLVQLLRADARAGGLELARERLGEDRPLDRAKDADRRGAREKAWLGFGSRASWTTSASSPTSATLSSRSPPSAPRTTPRSDSAPNRIGFPCSRRIWFASLPLPLTASKAPSLKTLQF